MIAIIDYGAGNVASVKNALDFLKVKSIITDDPKKILLADKVLFPGVGSFGDTMKSLREKRLIPAIKKTIETNKPFLGICLGLQVLFEESEESPGIEGLGIFKGKVKRFKKKLKVPQIGWNSIVLEKQDGTVQGLNNKFFYFVHSYYVVPQDKSIILTTTDYGGIFVSGISKENIYAFQFHPEKSGDDGLEILKRFARC
ncbi:imidazole glycerol phosphate synthase subunit HisH [Candidatus Woesearchaeota archaeon]|nr:imidazole glycerol phosphate synthase subunit HisH [Candidatus Woesearchaeota archaeon]